MWNELPFLWNELTILWNDLTWNDLTMERNDRIMCMIMTRSRAPVMTYPDSCGQGL